MEDEARQAAERRVRILAEHVSPGDRSARAGLAALEPSSTSGSSSRQYASATGEPTTYEKVRYELCVHTAAMRMDRFRR